MLITSNPTVAQINAQLPTLNNYLAQVDAFQAGTRKAMPSKANKNHAYTAAITLAGIILPGLPVEVRTVENLRDIAFFAQVKLNEEN